MIDDPKQIIANAIPVYKDWPKPGINYLNTVDICRDPRAFRKSLDFYYNIGAVRDINHVFAADARGFIWGSPTAWRLGVPLHVVRKKGKLPGEIVSREYELEYGTDTLEIRKVDIQGSILVVDDVLATGGTASAIVELLHDLGVPYNSITVACLVNISFLNGKHKLRDMGVDVETLINIDA